MRTSIVSFGLGSVQGSNPEGGQVQVDGHQLLQKVQELHEFVEQSFRQQGKLLRELRRVRRREWMQDVEVPDSLQPLGPEPLNASEGTEGMDKEENNVEEGLHRSSSHEEAQATQTEEKAVEKEVEGLEPPELAEGSRSNEARTTQMSVQSILVSSNYPEIGERPEATASGFDVRGSQRSQLSTLSMPSSVGGGRHAVRLSNRTNRSTKSNRSGSRSWTTDQSSPDSFLQDEYSRLFTAAQVQANWMQRKRAASDVDLSQLEQRPTRQFAKQIVESRCFTYTLTFLILVHVVLMGLEVDAHAALGNDSVPEWFDIANLILVCIFVGELFMKLMALGFMNFWCGKDCGWNAFDFLVISFSVADVVLALTKRVSVSTAQVRVFRLLRIFRYFRSIRVVRLFRYISALRVLTLSILGTMSSLAWTLALLVLIIYSFSVVLTEMVVQYCWQPAGEAAALCAEKAEDQPEGVLRTFFSSVPESMMSLFMAISQGLNWEDLIRPLWNVSAVAYYLVIVYVIITIFAILNVVTGVFCNTAIESAGADKDIRTLKQIQAKSQQVELLKSVFDEIDFEQVNEISFQDVKRCLANGDLASFVESMGISTDDVWTLFMLLDADQTGLLDLDEFVNGCMQLHGPAQSLQVAKMSYENKLTRSAIKNVFKELAEVNGRLVRLNRNLDEVRWQYQTQNESQVHV